MPTTNPPDEASVPLNKKVWLLDGNVLVAYVSKKHCMHIRADAWIEAHVNDTFATCAVTEGTLLRLLMHPKVGNFSAEEAWKSLLNFRSRKNHIFIDDGFSYAEVNPTNLRGHKEITDGWLAQLARRNKCNVVTFDAAFVARDADVAGLIA